MRRLKIFSFVFGCFIIFISFSLFILMLCASDKLDVDNYEEINQSIDGLKISHLSDYHSHGLLYNNSNLGEEIQKFNPDLIFITGDMVDKKTKNLDDVRSLLDEISSYPIYFVNGNHESNAYIREEFYVLLKEYSVNVLVDEVRTLSYMGKTINIIGLNDPCFTKRDFFIMPNKGKTEEVLDDLMKDLDGYNILLSHRPELINIYQKYNIDLIFSGHAHGGQLRLPLIGTIATVNQGLFPKYVDGRYVIGDTVMYVSRGLGTSEIDLRVNCNNQLINVTLKKSPAK